MSIDKDSLQYQLLDQTSILQWELAGGGLNKEDLELRTMCYLKRVLEIFQKQLKKGFKKDENGLYAHADVATYLERTLVLSEMVHYRSGLKTADYYRFVQKFTIFALGEIKF